MALTIRTFDPDSKKRWECLLLFFGTAQNDQHFLRAVLQENNLSDQISEEKAQKIIHEHCRTLIDFYSFDKFVKSADLTGIPFPAWYTKYCKFVIDRLQNSCRENICIEGQQNELFNVLKNLNNPRIGNFASTDEVFIEQGVKFLSGYLKLTAEEYQLFLVQKFKGKGVAKATPVAIKILKILGKRPNLQFTDDERRRFEKYKTFGASSFDGGTPEHRSTYKAMTIKPLELLKLTQNDLRNLWCYLT